MTFGRRSGKFPFMKARIYILVIVFAAGMVAALAQETKTNAAPGAGVVPPPVAVPATSAPAAVKEVKPPAAGTSTPTSPIPVQPKTATTPRMSSPESTATGHKEMATNPPPVAPATAEDARPLDEGPTPTNAASAETEVNPAAVPNAGTPSPETSGIDLKTTLLIGGAILVVAGGLAGFMWRRANLVSHGSLISSALSLTKYDDKTDDKVEEKPAEEPEAKKEEKKFPPPMN